MSSTLEVANRLVTLCKEAKFKEAMEELYSPNIVSIEPCSPPGVSPKSEGIAAVRAKADWWTSSHQIHSAQVFGPWPHGDRFLVHFLFEVTQIKGPMAGTRFTIDEMGLYTVANGKVVHEEFFYHMG